MSDVGEFPRPQPEQTGTIKSVITIEEFRKKEPPIIPQVYEDNPPGPVTRATFTDWLTKGFLHSRGKAARHGDYALWTESHGNFDAFQTIANFLKTGGYNSLSDSEKEYIQEAFNRIPRHANAVSKTAIPTTEHFLLNLFNRQINFMSDRNEYLSGNNIGNTQFRDSLTYSLLPEELREVPPYNRAVVASLPGQDRINKLNEIREEWQQARNAKIREIYSGMTRQNFIRALHTFNR